MASRPTATSFAILGLLGVKPWTAYELVVEARRNLRWFWPRSEAHLYAELKRLVERGHAKAKTVESGGRQRTRYSITKSGRAALKTWLATEPAPPVIEFETLLRLVLADQGSVDDLCAALEATVSQVADVVAATSALTDDDLDTDGVFSERANLAERAAVFYGDFLVLIVEWCEETLEEVRSWPSTQTGDLTVEARQRLATMRSRVAKALATAE